ncbi:MAG: bifunctional phosphoribosylaminoimidazolecarboxamide formyltransferase/IMP cyclohydrolase [Clostridia bacterium]|nr:MAG: bifunctional phosphoribosylaminoimidazolecarboxamide formyltransferase/IMP cyclohydrolase [Clostridia bacterium]
MGTSSYRVRRYHQRRENPPGRSGEIKSGTCAASPTEVQPLTANLQLQLFHARRALISVSDKTGVVDFARSLIELGFEIVSTGGTAGELRQAGVAVTSVEEVTGFPEMLDGRVKTLHPKIHAGLLALRTPEHLAQLAAQGIAPIELVAVNLYPFAATVARPDATWEEAIENIDIGGPTLVRAAAKNHAYVTVIVNPQRYSQVIAELRSSGEVSSQLRRELAWEAFSHTAAYDSLVAAYLEQHLGARGEVASAPTAGREPAAPLSAPGDTASSFPTLFTWQGVLQQPLRYGENPHQEAAFYRLPLAPAGTLARARQVQGKELSYNNIMDLEAAWATVLDLGAPAAVIIKHNNPCGAAVAASPLEAYRKAFASDPVSAFGGIVAFNCPVDGETVREVTKTFMEAVIAPSFTPVALEVLHDKENLRVLVSEFPPSPGPAWEVRSVGGGFLVQARDNLPEDRSTWQVVTASEPSAAEWEDLLFAWPVVKHVKSNAIVVARDKVTLGTGAGQMNRVGAARLALEQAGEKARGAVLASDAFFPFADTVEAAAAAGIRAIIQPGGSVRDEDSIKACNEHGMAMVFTGRRHFKH